MLATSLGWKATTSQQQSPASAAASAINGQSPCLLADVTQRPEFRDSNKFKVDTMPALLKNTLIIDLVSERVITTQEHWLTQGFPIPMEHVGPELIAWFPFAELIHGKKAFEPRVQRALTGNSMH